MQYFLLLRIYKWNKLETLFRYRNTSRLFVRNCDRQTRSVLK